MEAIHVICSKYEKNQSSCYVNLHFWATCSGMPLLENFPGTLMLKKCIQNSNHSKNVQELLTYYFMIVTFYVILLFVEIPPFLLFFSYNQNCITEGNTYARRSGIIGNPTHANIP